MKTKNLYFISLICGVIALLCSCEQNTIGDAKLLEGSWELMTRKADRTVSADLQGNSFVEDKEFVRNFDNKDQVWLFYKGYISWWSWSEKSGSWGAYICDCSKDFVVKGEGANMEVVETTRSIIPGETSYSYTTTYKVEKLTKKELILTTTNQYFISAQDTTIDVNETYIFRREDSLLDYIQKLLN